MAKKYLQAVYTLPIGEEKLKDNIFAHVLSKEFHFPIDVSISFVDDIRLRLQLLPQIENNSLLKHLSRKFTPKDLVSATIKTDDGFIEINSKDREIEYLRQALDKRFKSIIQTAITKEKWKVYNDIIQPLEFTLQFHGLSLPAPVKKSHWDKLIGMICLHFNIYKRKTPGFNPFKYQDYNHNLIEIGRTWTRTKKVGKLSK